MFLKHVNIVYDKSLPKHICSNIIKFCLEKQNIKKGTTRDSSSQKIRNSYVVWNNETWIKNIVMKYILDANKKLNWNFDISSCEDIQFTIYGQDQHYDWHMDSKILRVVIFYLILETKKTPTLFQQSGGKTLEQLLFSLLILDIK
jgi:hypothetical protein